VGQSVASRRGTLLNIEPMRVLCFGLDGADYDLVRELMAQGRLPTLSRLSREGVFGPLRSTIPPLTPVAWSSFLTGLNPGSHGIFGFSANPQRAVLRLESAANRAGVPLWRFLGAAGIRSAFITVPFTYPPEPLAGLLVTGWGGPQRPEILPATARERIFGAHPDLVTAQSPTGWWKELDAFTRKLIDHVDEIADVCLLAMELEPDLGLLCVDFMSSDIAGHLTWHRLDPTHPAHDEPGDELVRVYEAVDRACGELIEQAIWLYGEEPTVVILSDHGMKPTHWLFRTNVWLEQAGYLRYRPVSSSHPARDHDRDDPPRAEIDFDATRAYSVGYGGQIYLADGAGEGERALLAELEAALAEIPHPETGEPAFEVRTKHELYRGPFLDRAPELFLLPRDERVHADSSRQLWREAFQRHERLVVRGSANYSGQHALTGILAAAGPGIRPADVPDGTEIASLPATLLALLGLSPQLEAAPIEAILAQDALPERRAVAAGRRAPTEASVYSKSEEEEMIRRLRELGYE
jgi:predicted AlkP superfamily phosphohydrolase/phosphomutase